MQKEFQKSNLLFFSMDKSLGEFDISHPIRAKAKFQGSEST